MSDQVLELTAQISAAYARQNTILPADLVTLIADVHRTLATIGESRPEVDVPREPAVPIKKSVFPDYIICLEDGRRLLTLKRHLRTSYNLTPEQYRARWRLPANYPMVAPNHTNRRSEIAKKLGLGRAKADKPKTTILPARRARGSKG